MRRRRRKIELATSTHFPLLDGVTGKVIILHSCFVKIYRKSYQHSGINFSYETIKLNINTESTTLKLIILTKRSGNSWRAFHCRVEACQLAPHEALETGPRSTASTQGRDTRRKYSSVSSSSTEVRQSCFFLVKDNPSKEI